MDLLPRTHMTADLSREKVRTQANPRNSGTICPTLLIGQKVCQSLIKYSFLSIPIPPEVENTRGINETSSTSQTLSPYSLFFIISWCLYTVEILELWSFVHWSENPHIKKGTLLATPEHTSMNISPGIILPVSGGYFHL